MEKKGSTIWLDNDDRDRVIRLRRNYENRKKEKMDSSLKKKKNRQHFSRYDRPMIKKRTSRFSRDSSRRVRSSHRDVAVEIREKEHRHMQKLSI